MKYKYFNEDIATLQELKKQYKENAIELHPDNGGSNEKFSEMNSEYIEIFEKVKTKQVTTEGKIYTKETTETPEEFINIINELLKYEGLVIELIGVWIWISGTTRDYKEELKNLGCRYAPKKKMWSWHFEDGKRHYSTREKTIEELRNCYTSQKFEKEETKKIDGGF